MGLSSYEGVKLTNIFVHTPSYWELYPPDKAQKQALAPLAWALTALAPVYRLYRLHTRQKYEQQEPVWPLTALCTGLAPSRCTHCEGAEVDYRLSERRAARREPAKRRGSVLVPHEDLPQPLRSGLQACGRRW